MTTALDRLAAGRREGASQRLHHSLRQAGLLGQRISAAHGPELRIGGRNVLSFTSSSYLGLASHPALARAAQAAMQTWGIALSLPRLWASYPLMGRLEAEIARRVGQERALVFTSTTHAAQDVIAWIAGPHGAIFIDAQAYPISQMAARLAAAGGARLHVFRHGNAPHLEQLLSAERRRPKVIVCDGMDMAAGRPVPLRAYHHLAQAYDALMYVDDAQGVGLLGSCPTPAMPYGRGGGSLRYWDLPPGRCVHVSTLAKAYGVPLAFAAGPAGFIDKLAASAFSLTHNSPPAVPVAAAALAALELEAAYGDRLRLRLFELVGCFQERLRSHPGGLPGWRVSGHPFPMQSLIFANAADTLAAAHRLRAGGIWPIVNLHPAGGALRFILTAAHRPEHIERLAAALGV